MQRICTAGWIAAAVLCAAPAVTQDEEAREKKRLEGKWSGFVVEGRGERPDRGPVKLTEVVITADRITAKDAGNLSLGEGTYRLDPKARTIDAQGTGGPSRGKQHLGIYALEGDTLKWCVANPQKPRPTEFITRGSDGQYLLVLKRQKPAGAASL